MPDGLLFDPGPGYPTVWVAGLLIFLAIWWYAIRQTNVQGLWLALWVPGALGASLIFRLDQEGQLPAETIRLLVSGDAATLRGLFVMPSNGYAATYGFVVGGVAAALACMAIQFAGILLGGAIGAFGPRQRRRRA